MTMNAKLLFVLLALALCVGHSQAMSVFGGGRCQCVHVISKFIHPKHFQTMEVIPQSSNCKNVEIIVTMKSTKNQICLNPDAPWVRKVISHILDGAQTPKPTP
ncbi:interleukin-8-like [Petromyzon marinus]|uniref:Interleukin-8-like n=1 Tax=Petromyzon marinus TaxID=7757 RepID=A0AAJ7SNC6_PETMA|nr:interleukin-8-like [Petromyzon marinus]